MKKDIETYAKRLKLSWISDYFAVIGPPILLKWSPDIQLESGNTQLESTLKTGHVSGLRFILTLLHILLYSYPQCHTKLRYVQFDPSSHQREHHHRVVGASPFS